MNWPFVLGAALGGGLGAVVSWVFLFRLHERREFRRQDDHERRAVAREERAIERHGAQMAALDKNRSLTLQAVQQRSRLEVAVKDLGDTVKALEGRVARLEGP